MIKYPIVLLLFCLYFYLIGIDNTFVCLALHRTFLPAKVGSVCHTLKHEGTAGKYREKQRKEDGDVALFLCLFSPFYHILFS